MKEKPTVFISYNQKSASQIADKIQDRIFAIATVLRDTTAIPDWGSIEDFMKSIKLQDMVVMIITDEYLRSSACMFEVTQVMQSEGWSEHVMFVVADSASDIYVPKKWIGYLEYWEKEEVELKNVIESITDKAKAVKLIEEQKKIHQITMNLFDFFGSVKESKNPSVDVAAERIYDRVKGAMAANMKHAGDKSRKESVVLVATDDYEDKIAYAGRPSMGKSDSDKEAREGGGKMDVSMIEAPKNRDHMPILLLLDMSGSMIGREKILEKGIRRFVAALHNALTGNCFDERGLPLASFEVGVAVYNSNFKIVVPISSVDNKKPFEEFSLHASGATSLFGGFKFAGKYLQSYCGKILSAGGCVYGATLIVLGEGIATDCIDVFRGKQGIADRTYRPIRNGDEKKLGFSDMFHYIPIVLKNYDDGMEAVVQLYKLFPDWYRWKEKSVHKVDIKEANILFDWLSVLFVESGQCRMREDEDFPFYRKDILKQHTPWIERFDSEQLFTYMYNRFELPSRSRWSAELSAGLMLSGAIDTVEIVYQSILYFENTGKNTTCTDLISYTGRSQNSVRNALKKLMDDGRIRRIGKSRDTTYQAIKPSEREEREEKGRMHLSGSAETGEKINKNRRHFSFQFEKKEKSGDGTLYRFRWTFDSQHGYMSIIVREKDNKMSNSSLIDTYDSSPHRFDRPLGLYNDGTMLPVFKEALAGIGVKVDGVYAEGFS